MQVLSSLTNFALRAFAFALLLSAGTVAQAQNAFSTAIKVNESAITYFELDQRQKFLSLIGAPGSSAADVREALIEERLKKGAVRAAGIELSPEELEQGLEDFAGRANLTAAEFTSALEARGVDPQTFRDFVTDGLTWRQLIRGRFLARARPSDAEIDRALAADGSVGGVRVLLSEIIMPLTRQNQASVQARADQISQITSTAEFSSQARRFSATRTRANGGRMNWIPITNLPPQLRPQILALAPGQVTRPITLPNAVALFQLRDIEEIEGAAPEFSAIEYAAYYIPGGRTDAALAEAARITARIDTCDDLYGVAQGQPEEVLERGSLPPAEIPQDIAVELAKLDEGEVSTTLTRSNGQTLVLLMLCGRTAALNESASREDVANALIQQRLSAFSQSYIAQLRADALIIAND